MELKIFEVRFILNEVYSTDIAIVSASDEKHAYQLVADLYTADDWYHVKPFEELTDHNIKELKELQYNGTESKVISHTFYVE